MTSGVFHSCPLDQIVINRDERQRKDIYGISELADSIRQFGLIHPIVITRDYVLVAGERRYLAVESLGWTSINFQFVDEVDPKILKAIEYEENVKRQDLSEFDRARFIAAYHNLFKKDDPSWSQAQTAEALRIGDVDRQTGKLKPDHTQVSERIIVAEALDKGIIPKETDRYSAFLGAMQRKRAREADEEAAKLGYGSVEIPQNHILNCSFLDWARTYDGPRFNLIHCDFPFGIGSHKTLSPDYHMASLTLGHYDDSLETYKSLLSILSSSLDNIVEDSAHIIFWFYMPFYQDTFDYLTNLGFDVDPFPLIWIKSDNVGIIPNPTKSPRRIYETAFIGRCGDRNIVQSKSNAIAAPTTKLIHPHEKPEEVLTHFFEMLVDEHTSLLDPTCGSGTALRAAYRLGASRILGLEINPDYARQANIELNRLELDMEEPTCDA